MVEVHEEIVVVDVDRQLEGLGHLVVAEQVVEELSGQVVDLVREFVERLESMKPAYNLNPQDTKKSR